MIYLCLTLDKHKTTVALINKIYSGRIQFALDVEYFIDSIF